MNKSTRSVRFPRALDRRVRRTHHAVVDAFVALVYEKGYDAITVQDLLDRANIGRSTFYAHYRGKDDLLLRSFQQMLADVDAGMGIDATRVAPVRELFRHVGHVDAFHRALVRSNMLERIYQAGTEQLSISIEQRLCGLRPTPVDGAAPHQLAAQAYAGALFALLRWWIDHQASYSPEQMDEMFHGLVLAEMRHPSLISS